MPRSLGCPTAAAQSDLSSALLPLMDKSVVDFHVCSPHCATLRWPSHRYVITSIITSFQLSLQPSASRSCHCPAARSGTKTRHDRSPLLALALPLLASQIMVFPLILCLYLIAFSDSHSIFPYMVISSSHPQGGGVLIAMCWQLDFSSRFGFNEV